MVSNTTQHLLPIPPPPPPTANTVCVCTESWLWEAGRGGGGRREGRGATVHKRARKYQHDWLHLQSINSIKHKKRRHLEFGVLLVPSSMPETMGARVSCTNIFISIAFSRYLARKSCIYLALTWDGNTFRIKIDENEKIFSKTANPRAFAFFLVLERGNVNKLLTRLKTVKKTLIFDQCWGSVTFW